MGPCSYRLLRAVSEFGQEATFDIGVRIVDNSGTSAKPLGLSRNRLQAAVGEVVTHQRTRLDLSGYMDTPNGKKATPSLVFCESLFWIAVLVAVALSISIVVSLILIDFVHGNPNRPKGNAGVMMIFSPLIMFIAAPIGIFVVFSASQTVQGLMMRLLHPRFGRHAYVFVGLMVPFISILTWYCYDYLTPTDFNLGVNEGADWVPYQHGINLKRYMTIFFAQGFVTIFTLIYFEAAAYYRSRKAVVLGALFLAVVIGAFFGHREAINQYQFIDQSSR